ncbi:MAG: ABC transporter substrate-binding protein [Bacteroidota bacterium]
MKLGVKGIILTLLVLTLVLATLPLQAANTTTVRFWVHQHPPQIQYTQEVLIPEFKKTHPDVEIEFSYFPGSDYVQKLMVAFATGTGPDFFDLGDYYYPGFIEKGLIDPVDFKAMGYKDQAEFEALYMKNGLEGLKFGGKLYGIPIQQNSFSLLINTKYFKEAGLDPKKDYPKTWADIAKLAPKLAKFDANGRVIREAFDLPYNGPYWAMFTFDPLIRQFGGSVLTPDGKKAALNSKAGVAAMKMWQDLLYKSKAGDPNVSVATAAVPNEDFTQGKVAMWTTGPWALAQIEANPEVSKNTMVVPYPQYDLKNPQTMMYGFAWSVNKAADAQKKKAAWEFISMSANRPTEWLLKLGFPQPRLNWYKSSDAQTFPYLNVWMEDMAKAKFLPRTPYYNEVSQAVDRAIQRCMFNKMDPKQSLDIAADEINKVLAGK